MNNLSIEQLKEIQNLAEKYDYKPDEWHRKNLANRCGSDEILSIVRELISIRELKGESEPVTMDALRDAVAEMSGGLPIEWEKGDSKGHHAVPFINFNSLHRIVTKFTTPQKLSDLSYDVLFNAIGKAVSIQGEALSISVKAFKAAIKAT